METVIGEAKSFWKRPEGKTGMLFIAAVVLGGGFGLWHFLPVLIILLENTLYTALLGAAVAAISSPIWSTKVRFLFKGLMRKITGLIIKIDPISIMKGYIDTLAEKLAKVVEQISTLNGQIKATSISIEKMGEEISQCMNRASLAKERGQTSQLTLNARQASRLEKSKATLEDLQGRMQGLYKMLLKLQEICSITKQDIENEVENKEREYKSIQAAHGALKGAMSILNGGGEEAELYKQTLEHLQENYASKMGEIETAMTLSEGFLASVDLDNAAFEQEALQKLEKMAAGGLFEKAGVRAQVQVPVQETAVHQLYR